MTSQTPCIFLADVADAGTLAQLQIDFGAEFDVQEPPVEVLQPRFRRVLADPDAFALLAGSRTEPEGYALVTLRPTVYCDGSLAVLDELYVRPDLRAHGIGTALLSAAVQETLRRGGGEMHINVDEIDVDARRFYERHGFINIEPGTDCRMLCYLRELTEPPPAALPDRPEVQPKM